MLMQLISSIVKKLVDKPDAVTVQEVESDGKAVVHIQVAPSDMSRVIGSEGKTFRALRTLVQIMSRGQPKDLVVDSGE